MQPQFDVAVIGTGFSGLATAIHLKRDGYSFVVIERGGDVGGTWRDNDYPGAACDVPSHLYSFSFEPNCEWSRKYPTQPELRAYLRHIADKYGIRPHVRFDTTVTGADYDAGEQLWRLTTTGGTVTARALVSGCGGLSEPKLPDIPGVGSFRGPTFHSSRWDHSVDLAGKHVAVIGTGASAIQFAPEIAPKVARLDVYQRTPNWIIPRPDRAYTRVEKWAFRRVPGVRWLHRAFIYWTHELRVMAFVLTPGVMKLFQKVIAWTIARQVPDRALRQKLIPDYTIGCRRVLISNDWYPMLRRPNVQLITDGIREIRAHSVVTADGVEREVDCLIFGTGFYATDSPLASLVRNGRGESLAQHWTQGEEAYLGTLVKDFPNLFFIVGPNTGLGHTSMVFMIEAQVAYIRKLLRHLRDQSARTLEVRPAVQDRYNRGLQRRLGKSVWSTGCKSWYQHRSGKITALWPSFTFDFWWRTRRFSAEDYRLTA